jgi:hypothetical protein
MNSHQGPLEQIQDRLLKLERRNRRFKQLGFAVLIVATAGLVMGQASPHKTIEANEFILKDRLGRVRARLSIEELPPYSAASFVLYDPGAKEKFKVVSGFLGGGATMDLSDADGRHRVSLSANEHTGGILSLLDEKGIPGTVLHTDRAWLPSVEAASLSMIANGKRLALTSELIVFDRVQERVLGEGLIKIPIHEHVERAPVAVFTEDGLSVTDAQGFGVTIGATELTSPSPGETVKRSAASIVLTDNDRTVLWKVP